VSASVVGLDLSITATGIAYADGSTLTVRPTSAGDRRLVEIHSETRAAVTAADLVVIEDLPTHARAAGITGMVHGVVRRMLIARGQPYVLITPATLKKYATGKGNADKTAMALALYKRFVLELADDNQVDAWWLRAAGRELLGEPVFPLPAAQVAALDKVLAALAVAS
jgi:Holliday junction resolvasome RuvABC endonuclease subunit